MNAFDPAIFAASIDCLPCCNTPAVCPCPLFLPPFLGSPYSNIANAKAALVLTNCYTYADIIPADYQTDSNAATFDGVTLTGHIVGSRTGPGSILVAPILRFTHSGGDLTLTCTATSYPTEVTFLIYDCDWNLVTLGFNTGSSGVPIVITITALPAGDYNSYISINVPSTFGGSGSKVLTADYTLTDTGDYVIGPPIALWNDSGTTRQLEACPRLFLPTLTEHSGDWYASCVDAAAAITDLVSNCVGYIESLTNVNGFTATDGGTSLTLAKTLTAGAMTGPVTWGSVNAVNGQTITVTASVGAGTASLSVIIYDYTGTAVQTSGTVASPFVSSALPYEGRYTVSVLVGSSSNTTSLSAAITSSGVLTVNEVQAQYDIGLACPASLTCGDSCP